MGTPTDFQPIEAHQVALVATALALDLAWESDAPSKKTSGTWPRFSDELQDENRSEKNVECLDREQPFFQAFTLETCLTQVRTESTVLGQVVFEAWDYYLRELPESHGYSFAYDTWLSRRDAYARQWNDAVKSREQNPEMSTNPFFSIAMYLVEEFCGIGPDALTVVPITLAATQKANSFLEAVRGYVVANE